VNGEPGIFFLSEWIPNRLAVLIGPRLYGLPYRLGQLRYEHGLNRNSMGGRVAAPGGCLAYRAKIESQGKFAPAEEGSLSHFLLERYVACTHRDGVARLFRVEHLPWQQTQAKVELIDSSLIEPIRTKCGAELIGGNFSPGVSDVRISAPQRLVKA
jgi:hypothetical protein